MMNKLNVLTGIVILLFAASPAFSQGQGEMINEETTNPNSVRPIHEQNQMYKKRVWRYMDLREKQNQPFFARGFELSGFIIDMVDAGLLVPYENNDSLNRRMTKEEFFKLLELPDYGGGDDGFGGGGFDSGFGGGFDSGFGGEEESAPAEPAGPDYFTAQNVSTIEIMEDVIFDRKRSRMYYDIQSLKLIIPASEFPNTGVRRDVASFKYKDLYDLFREYPRKAIWFNRQNSAQHRNMADAFELRLFSSHITKFSNPNDDNVIDIYGGDPKVGIQASQWVEYEMLNYESGVWEY